MIKNATAIYTGGNIYIIYGELTDGNYFLTSNDWESTLVLDESPEDLDVSLYEDWQTEHTVKQVLYEESENLYQEAVDWVKKNLPDGNYDPDEL